MNVYLSNRTDWCSMTLALATAVSILASTSTYGQSGQLSLTDTVALAQQLDPWQQGSRLRQEALQAESISAGTFPDPQIAVGFANLPLDSLDFNQEAMTQFKVGVSQMFPRGQSLALEQQRLQLLGAEQPLMRQDRLAKVAVTVSQLWLDAYLARESLRLIEADRGLFEYLVEVAESSYASAVGKTRQQDIIRAQLELTRLDDRLTTLRLSYEQAASKLGEWLDSAHNRERPGEDSRFRPTPQRSRSEPSLELLQGQRLQAAGELDPNWLGSQLLQHPAILGIEQRIDAQRTGIALAEQKYKPQWGVNASYGYRDDAPDGMNRDDFFSVGLTFDLPIFTEKRQDKQLQSAVARTESAKTQKWLALRGMRATVLALRSQLLRLNQRHALYQGQLLGQMHEQAEASLNAYTNDDGDFAEVVRARIAELNAKIDALVIDIDRSKTIAHLNYFFTTTDLTGEDTGASS
ncbi:MAG: TolC family protein [Marinobacter sp.]|uniref:TolC family protein n=1 Tax=Marinobacter sp. TaxID=50741 RepID=UPI003297686B